MARLYGSDLIARWLGELGIEYAAYNPGATLRGLQDSLVHAPAGTVAPGLILCAHEAIAVGVAHGYAKAAGRPMAALLHNVVGLQNGSMAIYNAWCDRAPVLLIGGTGPLDPARRRPWIDWIHTALVQGNQVRDYVKWDDQPHTLEAVADSLRRADALMRTDPQGPVYVCLDASLQEDPAPDGLADASLGATPVPAHPGPDPAALRLLADWLVASTSPVIVADLVGQHDEAFLALVRLAELLGATVIDRGQRLNFPVVHPLSGLGCEADALRQADLVLALDVEDLDGALRPAGWSRGPARRLAAVTAKEMATRAWSANYQRWVPADLTLTASTWPTVPELLRLCQERARDASAEWRDARDRRIRLAAERSRRQREAWRRQALSAAAAPSNAAVEGGMPPAALGQAVAEALGGVPFVLANGTLGGWSHRLLPLERPRQYLGHEGGGGLGYGVAATLGAALAHRDQGVVCVDLQGDGDLLYAPAALWTAAHYRLPALIVLNNNGTYGNTEMHAARVASQRGRPAGSEGVHVRLDAPPVDFVGLARSFGVWAAGPVSEPDSVHRALRNAVEHVRSTGGPALVDVHTAFSHR